jgi:hypothetical protein
MSYTLALSGLEKSSQATYGNNFAFNWSVLGNSQISVNKCRHSKHVPTFITYGFIDLFIGCLTTLSAALTLQRS